MSNAKTRIQPFVPASTHLPEVTFRALFLGTVFLVEEGEPAFRWTDFLAGTGVEAAFCEGVRFIFLSVFRVIICCLLGRLFRSEAELV